MSDSIPITLHLLSAGAAGTRFGPEVATLLAKRELPAQMAVGEYERWRGPKHFAERKIEAYSSGGMFTLYFGKLVTKAGLTDLGFLGDLTFTHEAAIDLGEYGSEKLRFTVIKGNYDYFADLVRQFIAWCRENALVVAAEFWGGEYGNDLDGREFETIEEAIDKTLYSLDPNKEYGSWDSEQFVVISVAFSFLRSLIYLLSLAKRNDHWVVCQQWGGIEPRDVKG
ncbi:MAG: hypothetical protein V4858_25190 [Pseudomonadota bacterium]